MKIKWFSFLKDIPVNFLFMIFTFTFIFTYNEFQPITTLIELVISIFIALLVVIMLAYFSVVSKKDKTLITK